MEDVLMADDFLEQSKTGIMIDVRSPSEFEAGHIPGARNLPLFSDNERAEIGTRYVQYGKDNAVERGLEIVGPKLAGFVKQARLWADGTPIYMYCWRGGMRSGSMAWLFRTAGLTTYLLSGGYKAYRNSFAQLLEAHPWQLLILGGPTGCGKTEVLHQLQRMEQQVIDLEGLAHHKGSAFGSLGETAQPSTEQFTN
ncbi:MAG: tRNA 2-selenouridine(34) synthase MnmH, partial [Macellibacteroides sp.]|uniref:tRNA 2-selenouridine(34) synthase MnmH n=1 Tax=Macellibacteroides sp. TaxID=2014584 RepID=UPI003E78556A